MKELLPEYMNIVQNVIEPTALKAVTSSVLLVGFFFGDLYTQGLIAVLMLIIFDTILGMMAEWSEGHPITSRKFARVLQKSIVYLIAISSGYYADHAINFTVIQSLMIGFVGVTEFISILENMGRMGYQTPKKLLNQLKDFQSLK